MQNEQPGAPMNLLRTCTAHGKHPIRPPISRAASFRLGYASLVSIFHTPVPISDTPSNPPHNNTQNPLQSGSPAFFYTESRDKGKHDAKAGSRNKRKTNATDEHVDYLGPSRQDEVRCVTPVLQAVLHLVQNGLGELVSGRVAAHVGCANLAVVR
jgi:hypothetical protein